MFVRRLVLLWCVVFLAVGLADDAQRSGRVRGYFRKDGTYVAPHYRSAPDGSFLYNWSTRGNVNPYKGKVGSRDYPPVRSRSGIGSVTASGAAK